MKEYLANPIWMAIFGLTFCYGAYMSEIYRAGIQSIQKGQMEAARSLGMTHFQAMRYVVIPQAIRVILPPVGNEFISMLKDSSLVSVVAVADMTRRGREFMAANFIPIQTWVMIALLYLVLTLFSARVVTWIEKRTRIER
jgi:polar amino acid transport system permease protein